MVDEINDTKTTEQVDKFIPNPNGKGGFADNPQNINPGGRPKNEQSFTYWMKYFKNLTVEEFLVWEKSNPKKTRYVAADIAYNRVFNSRKDLQEFKELADRTEGKSPQTLIHEGGFFSIDKLKIEIVEPREADNEAEPEAT